MAAQIGSRPDAISDLLLCLHAYAAWGENFVDFLAGDFCFALWDDERSRLICVRDQLGVRSLFHAEAGNSRFVGDSLDWIVSHAPVDRDLDDYWIADFLSVGRSLDFDRTVRELKSRNDIDNALMRYMRSDLWSRRGRAELR